MWPSPARYGEMGMFVVAPATSFHHHESLIPDAIPSSNAAIGVIPLFNVPGDIDGQDLATSTNTHNRSRTAGVGVGVPLHLWQNQQQQIEHENNSNNNSYGKKTIDFETAGNSFSTGTATCQDCGNQAKKDCPHRRCRTCCRSRGLDCSTHVKSTWVPAARRRERQMIVGGGVAGASSGSTSGAKKPRMIISSATTTSSNTVDTGSSGHQVAAGEKGSMPAEVKAPAVFKCVRVTTVEGGEDEFAYQAVVRIGGHVFKGLLYDKGSHHIPNMSELHLGSGSGSGGGGGERNGVSSTPVGFPAEVYGSSGAGFHGGGSTFGNTIN